MRTFAEVRGDMSRVLGRLKRSRDTDERRSLLLKMRDLVAELDSIHHTGISEAKPQGIAHAQEDLSIWVMARLLGFDVSDPSDPV